MKRRKVASLCAALGLVAVIGIGGTLAYFTDNTEKLTNTFAMAQKGIEMELWESAVQSDGAGGYDQDVDGERVVAGESPSGNNYRDVQPGADIYKDPTVTIKANSVDCYVYASVKTYDEAVNTIDPESFTSAWAEIQGITTKGNDEAGEFTIKYYVYGSVDAPTKILNAEDDTRTEPIFRNVKVAESSTETDTLMNIEIRSAAIQANNIEVTEAQDEALALLGYVEQ